MPGNKIQPMLTYRAWHRSDSKNPSCLIRRSGRAASIDCRALLEVFAAHWQNWKTGTATAMDFI